MAHLRTRHIEPMLKELSAVSPLIGILGHRQVGKTTLLEKLCEHYYSFDQREELLSATQDPEAYLNNKKKVKTGLDECQLVPGLFPALKERVRVDKRPGQFFLSGSVRFTSKKSIQESLTGRISSQELLPFTLSELQREPLSDRLQVLNSRRDFRHITSVLQSRPAKAREQMIRDYWEKGGLPGICFLRKESLRIQKIEDQLQTILDRDLRQLITTKLSYRELREFYILLSKNQGEPINYAAFKQETGLSVQTLKNVLFAFESLFLIRTLSIRGNQKGAVLYLEDQGEAYAMSGGSNSPEAQLEHFIYVNARAQWRYRVGQNTSEFHYRTRGGARIPICFENKDGILGILPTLDKTYSRSHKATAESFLKTFSNSKVLILNMGTEIQMITDRILLAPAESVL